MDKDFDFQRTGHAASEESPEDFDELQISDLPLDESSHPWLLFLDRGKQRLLNMLQNVSRATLQDIARIDRDGQAAEHTAQAESGDFELEISELQPTEHSHYLLLRFARLFAIRPETKEGRTPQARHQHSRRYYAGRVLAVISICILLLLLLMRSIPDLPTRLASFLQPAASPTPGQQTVSFTVGGPVTIHPFGPDPSSSGQASPGPLPTTCPHLSPLQYFTTPLDPPGLGASAVWLSGFTGPGAILNHLLPIDAQVAHANWPGGWYETVAVFIQKGFPGDITLRGSSQKNGQPVLLSKNDPQVLSTTLTLNLNNIDQYIPNGQWEMTSVVIAVPTADCYTLQASWSTNSWVRYFAAGA